MTFARIHRAEPAASAAGSASSQGPPDTSPQAACLKAERAVLGAILRLNACLNDVAPLLLPDDFSDDRASLVYAAMLALWDAGKPVDLVTLADRLHAQGQVPDAGGYGWLGELWDATPTAAHAVHHARIVREHSLRRRLALATSEIYHLATEGVMPADELLETAEQKIFALASVGASGAAVPLSTALHEALEHLDRLRAAPGRASGVPAGLADLDRLTGGWQPGELIVLGARPSLGKSWLALSFLRHAAQAAVPAFFASLEMSRLELAQRLLAMQARLPLQYLRRGNLSRDESDKLLEVLPLLRSAPVWIDDGADQGMTRIAATCRRLKAKHQIGLVVIDYLQLITPAATRGVPRHEQVAEISRRLKCLAKELAVPVIALCQLNRAAEDQPRPSLASLRESGAIEADADTVLLLHREKARGQQPLPSAPQLLEIIIAKQRNGPTGDVPCIFHRATGTFENYEEGEGPANPFPEGNHG